MGLRLKSSMMSRSALVSAASLRSYAPTARAEASCPGAWRGGEHGVVAATYGNATQCLGDVALAGAAGADDEHRDFLLQVAAGGQIHDLRMVHSEVEGEVVAFERLLRVDAGPALPHDEFAL